jgi:hypothetical protein
MAEPAAAGCPTCGAAVNGRFCAACGEQTVAERDYSVAHYARYVFESLTKPAPDLHQPRTAVRDRERRLRPGALTPIGIVGYLSRALRRVFGGGRAAAVARTLGMTVLIYPIVLTYRFLLFFVTLWTMR